MKKRIFVMAFGILLSFGNAQESEVNKESDPVSFGVDLYSRYIWRGLEFSDAPNIQPWISWGWKGLNLMVWGSYAASKDYSEVDVFFSYTWKNLSLGINDYFNPAIDTIRNDYSIWKKTTTSHLVEAYVTYQLPFEKAPFKFTASTFFYGADRDDELKNRYSTYLEVAYPFKSGDIDIQLFAGATIDKGYYAENPGFVNVGTKVVRNIKVTETFEIPLNASLVFHPENRNVFLVVGVSF